MVGGWSWRWKAAGSGRAASTVTLVSGRWACGSSGYTIPDPDLSASPASRVGPVIYDPEGRPEKGLVCRAASKGVRRCLSLSSSLERF